MVALRGIGDPNRGDTYTVSGWPSHIPAQLPRRGSYAVESLKVCCAIVFLGLCTAVGVQVAFWIVTEGVPMAKNLLNG